ncbi:unnamed protein product, partial [Ectocarpus sp. 6 AP-2014]
GRATDHESKWGVAVRRTSVTDAHTKKSGRCGQKRSAPTHLAFVIDIGCLETTCPRHLLARNEPIDSPQISSWIVCPLPPRYGRANPRPKSSLSVNRGANTLWVCVYCAATQAKRQPATLPVEISFVNVTWFPPSQALAWHSKTCLLLQKQQHLTFFAAHIPVSAAGFQNPQHSKKGIPSREGSQIHLGETGLCKT